MKRISMSDANEIANSGMLDWQFLRGVLANEFDGALSITMPGRTKNCVRNILRLAVDERVGTIEPNTPAVDVAAAIVEEFQAVPEEI